MADTPTNWLSLATEAYSASNTYFDASIRRQIESDLRQFQGLHPAASKYLSDANKSRSRLFRPKTRATIRKNEAVAAEAFFSTKDVVSIEAEDDEDDQQQSSAAIMLELLQYRLTKSIPWFQTLIGAYQDALTVGTVASYQYWEFEEKKKIDRPCVRLIALENLRFDPGAHWTDPVNTSPYIIELIPMYVKDVRARMQTPDPRTKEPKWKSLDEQAILSAVKNYGDSIRLVRENGRTDSKEQQSSVTAFSVVWIHKNIIEQDGIDYMYYTLGTQELLSDPKPLDEVYYHGRRPYVIGSAIIETHKNYPSSLPKLGKDVQAEINEVANLRIDNIKFALNKRYFVKRNSQVDLRSLTRNVPGSVTLMNTLEDVKAQEFGDVTGSSYQEQDRLNLDFDEITGNFSNSSVQSNRKMNETVGGMNILTTDSNQMSGYQLRTFVETWVEPVLRQLVLLEQYYETDETIMALAGKKAKLFERFGIDAITDDLLMHELTVNVNVGMGATNPTEKINRFMTAMNSLRNILADGQLLQYGMDIKEVIKELFGNLGYRDGGRFFKTGEDDPRIKAMQDMITQLQQELSQKISPELVAAQVRKIDAEIAGMVVRNKKDEALAVKTMVEAEFSAMQGAEVVATVPHVAPIADAIMVNAGYQSPTPAGQDPNFPDPVGVAAAAPQAPAMAPIEGVDPATTVDTPNPATAGEGVRQGIETVRADSAGYAEGGEIVGPGDGTSDSIPAVNVDTGEPMKVSNGEMYIPPEVVAAVRQAIAPDFFETLIEQFHSEAPDSPDAAPASDSPLMMESGGVIIPADVVEALGVDYFQQMIREYSA